MARYFEPAGGVKGGAAVALDEVEISILRNLAVQMLELIGPGDEGPVAADPLDALFAEGPSAPPTDPALARLFPDAYGEPSAAQDEETRLLSAEFRRYTEPDLRAGKRDNLLSVVRALDALTPEPTAEGAGAVLTLRPEESRRWLGALNDIRLAIGARLDIRDDADADRLFALADDDPNKPMVLAYLWLGGLQESLVGTLQP